MNLSENLHYLRKRAKITQEELADRLGVSRQSVSKWETGEAYPETDKLISLCDIFNVSLDALVRTDLTVETEAVSNAVDGKSFITQINRFSRSIALGVFLILLGVAICVALSGVSFTLEENISELTAVMGCVAVLICVAVAVFLFIFSGMNYERFKRESPVMCEVYTLEEVKNFTKRFNLSMALLVAGILADVVFLVVLTSFIDAGIIPVANENAVYCYVTSAFLFVLSLIVGMLVYNGIQRTKYFVNEYNKQTNSELNPSRRTKLKDAICGAVMMLATALFLVLGFVGGWWHPGWIVFPVGGIICGIISALMNAKDD